MKQKVGCPANGTRFARTVQDNERAAKDAKVGLQRVRENSSFAPLGLDHFPLVPTAYAVGSILSPLRG